MCWRGEQDEACRFAWSLSWVLVLGQLLVLVLPSQALCGRGNGARRGHSLNSQPSPVWSVNEMSPDRTRHWHRYWLYLGCTVRVEGTPDCRWPCLAWPASSLPSSTGPIPIPIPIAIHSHSTSVHPPAQPSPSPGRQPASSRPKPRAKPAVVECLSPFRLGPICIFHFPSLAPPPSPLLPQSPPPPGPKRPITQRSPQADHQLMVAPPLSFPPSPPSIRLPHSNAHPPQESIPMPRPRTQQTVQHATPHPCVPCPPPQAPRPRAPWPSGLTVCRPVPLSCSPDHPRPYSSLSLLRLQSLVPIFHLLLHLTLPYRSLHLSASASPSLSAQSRLRPLLESPAQPAAPAAILAQPRLPPVCCPHTVTYL